METCVEIFFANRVLGSLNSGDKDDNLPDDDKTDDPEKKAKKRKKNSKVVLKV